MGTNNYDFAGWVTKNDMLCADGVTIKHDAFKDNHGKRVPLVWNHDYNTPENVLGSVLLENHETGVYGYGTFNETDSALHAKELVKHGDIESMSIGARKIKRNGSNVTHGLIYEVSLVMAGANPGATIETVVKHSDQGDDEEGVIYTGTRIHSADDIVTPSLSEDTITHAEGDTKMAEDKPKTEEVAEEKTVKEILDTLSAEQAAAVQILLETVVDELADDEDEKPEEKKGDGEMKQNAFEGNKVTDDKGLLKHSVAEALTEASRNNSSSFKQVLEARAGSDEVLKHGINSIDMLFPEVGESTNGNEPILYTDPNTAYSEILKGVSKSPFAKVRTTIADLTEDEARAKGYIKGTMKKEEFFSLIRRVTGPATVYKKQKLDRDDILDITDFDVVSFMAREMRGKLEEEIARAILVGDGRDVASEDKINEQAIRPILTDHEFFTIHKAFTDTADFIEAVIRGLAEYRGSGTPTMYIDPVLLMDVKLLKDEDGKYMFGDIPSTIQIAARFGVDKIVPTTFMSGNGALLVNLRDYQLGATNGGQIANFNDFDIDFNQYKYLIETRLSGALTMPKSALHIAADLVTGATDEVGGVTYGARMPVETPETPET